MQWETATPAGVLVGGRHNDWRLNKPGSIQCYDDPTMAVAVPTPTQFGKDLQCSSAMPPSPN